MARKKQENPPIDYEKILNILAVNVEKLREEQELFLKRLNLVALTVENLTAEIKRKALDNESQDERPS